MKIVATIEVPVPDFDEESKDQWKAVEALKNNPEEMIERIYREIDGGLHDYGVHSPRLEDGEI